MFNPEYVQFASLTSCARPATTRWLQEPGSPFDTVAISWLDLGRVLVSDRYADTGLASLGRNNSFRMQSGLNPRSVWLARELFCEC